MAQHVLYRLKAEETIYRMVYHTYRFYRVLGYKSILKSLFAKLVFEWVKTVVVIKLLLFLAATAPSGQGPPHS